MSATRYRLSFKTPEGPGGWVQALAQACVVRVQREVPRYGYAQGALTTDHVPVAMVAEHVERHGMRVAEVVFGGIVRRDAAFLDWVNRRFRAPPEGGALVVAQFDDVPQGGDGDRWRGWACYAHAVAMAQATVTGLEMEPVLMEQAVVLRLTVTARDLHRSEYPSPLVPPLDLLPGTIFYPYVPLQISSAWPTGEEQP